MKEEASANLFVTKVINLGASGKSPTKTEKEFLPLVNTEIEDAAKQTKSTQPKQHSKPSVKLIENRFQADTLKLENMWEKTVRSFSNFKGTPDSVEAIRKAIGVLCSTFSDYELV